MSTIPSWAVKGAKVVCIKAHEDHDLLVAGQVYHIASIAPYWMGKAAIVLAEHLNPSDTVDGSYYLERFRPLVTLEADLEAYFTKLLHNPQPEGVE